MCMVNVLKTAAPVAVLLFHSLLVQANGIERLAPVQSFGVDIIPAVEAQALAPATGMFVEVLYDESFIPDEAQHHDVGLSTKLLSTRRSLRQFSVHSKQNESVKLESNANLLTRRGALHGWTLGDKAWRYQASTNAELLIGSASMVSPDWQSSPTLGGVQLSQRFNEGQYGDEPRSWSYSLSVGALDHNRNAKEGDLKYGPTVGGLWVDMALSKQLQVEAVVESAPAMHLTGVGTRYSMDGWGSLSSSVARANHRFGSGWRYQMRYDTAVLPSLKLSVSSEHYQGSFLDLNRYGQSSLGAGTKQVVDANVAMGRWGSLEGSYMTQQRQFGAPSQQVGLSQQFWYSPNLRLGLQAQRQLHNGDYNMLLRFAVPLR